MSDKNQSAVHKSAARLVLAATSILLAVTTPGASLRCHTCNSQAGGTCNDHVTECVVATPEWLREQRALFFPEQPLDLLAHVRPACYYVQLTVDGEYATLQACSALGTNLTCEVLRSKFQLVSSCTTCDEDLCNEQPRDVTPEDTSVTWSSTQNTLHTQAPTVGTPLQCYSCVSEPDRVTSCSKLVPCLPGDPAWLAEQRLKYFPDKQVIDFRVHLLPPACYSTLVKAGEGEERYLVQGCSALGHEMTCDVLRNDPAVLGPVEFCSSCQHDACNTPTHPHIIVTESPNITIEIPSTDPDSRNITTETPNTDYEHQKVATKTPNISPSIPNTATEAVIEIPNLGNANTNANETSPETTSARITAAISSTLQSTVVSSAGVSVVVDTQCSVPYHWLISVCLVVPALIVFR